MKQYWNKTKVVCTIGPSCSDERTLKKLILAGMDIARLNFSHGKISDHIMLIKRIKGLAAKLNVPVAVMQDLPGPKIRIGELREEFIDLKHGQNFYLTAKEISGTSQGVSINDAFFVRQLKKNDLIFLNDGLVRIKVRSRAADRVNCEVLTSGRIYPKKGVSCPSMVLKRSAVTRHDWYCLKKGVAAGVDFIAVSFVQSAQDIIKVKRFLKKNRRDSLVIAKIERRVAFQDIDRIIAATDGVMVARGDLGIEASLEEIPFLQKEIIRKANMAGCPVITATQMLESMVHSPQPTRAEVTDVANAIIDGTDAVMLSEETAVGSDPLAVVNAMTRISTFAESRLKKFRGSGPREANAGSFSRAPVEAFSFSAAAAAEQSNARLIIAPTNNAASLAKLSGLRPEANIVAFTSDPRTYRMLILFWGVYPVLADKFGGMQETLRYCIGLVKKYRLAAKGDKAIIMLTEDNGIFTSNIMEILKVK